MESSHNGHFRLYRADNHLHPWRLEGGTDNGWNSSIRWVDVEPNITITLGRDKRRVWLQGHAEVLVDEADCCPNGYASVGRPYDSEKSSIYGAKVENHSLDWVWTIAPAAKAADLVLISGLFSDSGLMVLRLTERGRLWLGGKLTPCANLGSGFVHFAHTNEATTLLGQARDAGFRVAEADIAKFFRKTK